MPRKVVINPIAPQELSWSFSGSEPAAISAAVSGKCRCRRRVNTVGLTITVVLVKPFVDAVVKVVINAVANPGVELALMVRASRYSAVSEKVSLSSSVSTAVGRLSPSVLVNLHRSVVQVVINSVANFGG